MSQCQQAHNRIQRQLSARHTYYIHIFHRNLNVMQKLSVTDHNDTQHDMSLIYRSIENGAERIAKSGA